MTHGNKGGAQWGIQEQCWFKVHTSIQGSVKLYHSRSQKIKMAEPPLKTRRYTPLQETKLHKAGKYKEERKTFNSMVT